MFKMSSLMLRLAYRPEIDLRVRVLQLMCVLHLHHLLVRNRKAVMPEESH